MSDFAINLSPETQNNLIWRFHHAKGYYFDCDGTVVDSETGAMKMVCDTLFEEAQKQGVHVDRFAIMGMFGRTIPEIIEATEKNHGIKFDNSLKDTIHANTVEMLRREARGTDGMQHYLDITHAIAKSNKAPHAVVTSSGLDRVNPSLDTSGLMGYFGDGVFSATSTLNPPKPKPDPAIYLYACQKFGIDPKDAVTHEDSASGVKSAKAAGVGLIIGYIGGSHIKLEDREAHAKKLYEAGADIVFDSWSDAEKFFMKTAIEPKLFVSPVAKPREYTH